MVERRGEEGLSIKPVICYQTFPGYPQSSTGDSTSGVSGQTMLVVGLEIFFTREAAKNNREIIYGFSIALTFFYFR